MSPSTHDYFATYQNFDYAATVRNALSGTLEAMNACHECCDRHALPGRIGLLQENADGTSSIHSYIELRDQAAQFANFLTSQGVGPGDVVAGLLPRSHELLITILGTWRAGAVYQPLFTAFGPKAIEHRLHTSGARLVSAITSPRQTFGCRKLPDRLPLPAPGCRCCARYSFRAEIAPGHRF